MTGVYCTAPWNGVTIREDGLVRTCCVGSRVLADLNVESVDAIERSQVLLEIKQKMASGLADEDNCRRCREQENSAGSSSLRDYYNRYYPHINDVTKLSVIDLRWNNTCNLACVYCGPDSSSTWSDRLKVTNLRPVRGYQDSLMLWILQHVSDVREIMLVGGEPMLMKQNYQLLEKLPQDCQISIITNLSYDLPNLPCMDALMSRPVGKVLWNISAENTERKFEYVRSGASWSKFTDNLVFLQEKFPESQTITMVYNVLSAFDLPDTVDTFMQHGIKKFVLQPVMGNPGLDVFRLPDTLKKSAADRMQLAMDRHANQIHAEDRGFYSINLAKALLAQLQNPSTVPVISKNIFLQQIAKTDRWNHNKFSDLWSDLHDRILQHLE